MTAARPLLLGLALLLSALIAVSGAWAQQASGARLPVILGTAAGAFTGTAVLMLAALAYLGGS